MTESARQNFDFGTFTEFVLKKFDFGTFTEQNSRIIVKCVVLKHLRTVLKKFDFGTFTELGRLRLNAVKLTESRRENFVFGTFTERSSVTERLRKNFVCYLYYLLKINNCHRENRQANFQQQLSLSSAGPRSGLIRMILL